MRWLILAVGKPKLPFARVGIEEYARRFGPMAPLDIRYLKAGSRETESAALLEKSAGHLRIVLDERGEEVTSRALAERVSGWEQARVKSAALLVGGAEGHTGTLLAQAEWRWSLSRLTLQHELALLIALEQLYRAYSIKAGAPYHRD